MYVRQNNILQKPTYLCLVLVVFVMFNLAVEVSEPEGEVLPPEVRAMKALDYDSIAAEVAATSQDSVKYCAFQ